MKNEEKYTCPFRFQMISASMLTSEQQYQREINNTEVKTLVENFNRFLAHPILVSSRNGKYYVYDGQHTLSMFIKKFGKDVVVPALIVEGLSEEEEAFLFCHQSDYTRKLSTKNILNAGFVANEEDVLGYCQVLRECGFEWEFREDKVPSKDGVIRSHGYPFNQIFMKKQKGAKQLKLVFDTINCVWAGSPDSLKEEVLKGIDVFTFAYRGEYDYNRLITALRKMNPGQIKKDAGLSMAKGSGKYGYAILSAYNRNLPAEKKLENRFA